MEYLKESRKIPNSSSSRYSSLLFLILRKVDYLQDFTYVKRGTIACWLILGIQKLLELHSRHWHSSIKMRTMNAIHFLTTPPYIVSPLISTKWKRNPRRAYFKWWLIAKRSESTILSRKTSNYKGISTFYRLKGTPIRLTMINLWNFTIHMRLIRPQPVVAVALKMKKLKGPYLSRMRDNRYIGFYLRKLLSIGSSSRIQYWRGP